MRVLSFFLILLDTPLEIACHRVFSALLSGQFSSAFEVEYVGEKFLLTDKDDEWSEGLFFSSAFNLGSAFMKRMYRVFLGCVFLAEVLRGIVSLDFWSLFKYSGFLTPV